MSPLLSTVFDLQPRHYLVDTYLEQSLMRPSASCACARMMLDSAESHYLDYLTGGAWFQCVGMSQPSPYDSPKLRAGLVVEQAGVRTFALEDAPFEVGQLSEPEFCARTCETLGASDTPSSQLSSLLRGVTSMPLRASFRNESSGIELILTPVRAELRQRFSCAPYKDQLVELLRTCSCDEVCLDALVRASFVYGFPFVGDNGQQSRRIVSVDLGYLALRCKDGELSDVRAGILITDRYVSFDGMMLKPMITYQWHITDSCDQRCKHCYLFAEDAAAHCLSTPWEMLIHTLDEVEDVAARRHLVPMLAVSGGDPILHPRFWDLAAELKRRGIRWSAMGNPFHLNEDVCRHLRSMGCCKYQLSLDGLQQFHDYLRKPGSFKATLAAIEPLRAAGIKVQLMATASRANLDDILACMDLAGR